MFSQDISRHIVTLDALEFSLLLWILFLSTSLFFLRIVFEVKKRMCEHVLEGLLLKIQEQIDLQTASQRTSEQLSDWLHIEENQLLANLRNSANPDRVREILYSIVREVIASERLEQWQDDWQFIGPNGDTKEYLHREDLEGLYFRSGINQGLQNVQ